MTVGQVGFLSTVYLVDHGNWPKQCLLNLPKWDKWSTNQRASILRVRSIAHEYSMVKQKGPMLPEDQDWVSQPVLVIQLWNKAGIWCKFRTNNLSSPWSKFIWSQGPAADESTCAHQKCCATGAEVSSESSGWVVVWVAFGRKIQDDPGKFRDQACSDLMQCAPQIPTEVASTETKKLTIYYHSIYHHPWSLGIYSPAFGVLEVMFLIVWTESVFKSWTLSVLTSWIAVLLCTLIYLLYIWFKSTISIRAILSMHQTYHKYIMCWICTLMKTIYVYIYINYAFTVCEHAWSFHL